jgi:hypothetical protein
MTMVHTHSARHGVPRGRRRKNGLLALPLLILLGGILLAAITIAWLLWPRWPAPNVPVDAPSLPITIQDVTFNVPPAAIRVKAQRKPGTLDRVDLVFMWPALAPPDLGQRPEPAAGSRGIDRIFVTIAGSDGTLPPIERFKTIYPRYLDSSIGTTEGGLAVRPFRDGSPYQGEELLYDGDNPERFLARCTRDRGSTMIGMCLYQRRIGKAEVTVRFPREWLANWQNVLSGFDKLVASFRASGI